MGRVGLFLAPPHTPCHVILPFHPTTLPRLRHRPITAHQHQISNLGHTLLSATAPIPKEEEEEAQIISGSDVLLALQRVTSLKKNNKKKKSMQRRVLSSVANPREQKDYTNVKPLCINTEWGAKLDDLEKRLRELSSHATTII
ncbi:hypothetical protein RIF29_24024 [Crotalaria pallida]|uniref:Uncharacterized protein n=1 Tax=Crotalaria pallida TaxID=3830 RepID=A0AAN9EJJ5_CROPI